MLKEIISNKRLLRKWSLITLAMLPSIVIGSTLGHWELSQLVLLSASLYSIQTQSKWGVGAIIFHEVVILAGLYLLTYSLFSPLAFAITCTLFAGACMGLGIYNPELRKLGSWILIPALYMTIDFQGSNILHSVDSNVWFALQLFAVAALGPVLVCLFNYILEEDNSKSSLGFNNVFTAKTDVSAIWTVIGIMVAVFVSSIFVQWLKIPHAEWVIWSTISVSTGDMTSMHRKLAHRVTGALVGMIFGVSLVVVLQLVSPLFFELAGILIPFTLFIKRYPLAYASRCTLIALAAGALVHGTSVAEFRMLNVLIGGILGVLCAYLAAYMANKYHHKHPVSD